MSAPESFLADRFAANHRDVEIARVKLGEKSSVRDKLSAMKSLVSMISEGSNASGVYPDVVKTLICPDTQVQRLVAVYLMHYAEFKPEEALLSVNTFQKLLTNANAVIRTHALRVLTSIRLPVIVKIQVLAIQTGIKDASPYVRKAALHSVVKISSISPKQLPILIPIIEVGLADPSLFVLSSALAAFWELCPTRYDMIHSHFRKFCDLLLDMNHWGQVYLLNILMHYARDQFQNPNYSMDRTKSESESSESSEDSEYSYSDEVMEMDPDLELLLRSVLHLLGSSSTAVVSLACSLIFYCAPDSQKFVICRPLLRLAREPRSSYMALQLIKTISFTRPEIFSGNLSFFYLLPDDGLHISSVKIEILTNLTSDATAGPIVAEYKYYLSHYLYYNQEVITAVIESIGGCLQRSQKFKEMIVSVLLSLLTNPSPAIIAKSLIQIKKLAQHDAGRVKKVISCILQMEWMEISSTESRACIIWIFGEYCRVLGRQAPDILRLLLQNFPNEEVIVKQQILNFAAKMYALVGERHPVVPLLFQYTCKLAEYDSSYDLRDRCRIFRHLLSPADNLLHQHAIRLVCSPKPTPVVGVSYDPNLCLGSLSHIVNQRTPGYMPLLDWNENPSPIDRTRRNEGSNSVTGCTGYDGDLTDSDSYSESSYYDSSEEEDPLDAFFGTAGNLDSSGIETANTISLTKTEEREDTQLNPTKPEEYVVEDSPNISLTKTEERDDTQLTPTKPEEYVEEDSPLESEALKEENSDTSVNMGEHNDNQSPLTTNSNEASTIE